MTYFASSRLARCGLKWELKHWKGILKNPDEYQKENDLEPLSWEDISGLLKDAGYNGTFDTKGERTTAAEHLVAFSTASHQINLTSYFTQENNVKNSF